MINEPVEEHMKWACYHCNRRFSSEDRLVKHRLESHVDADVKADTVPLPETIKTLDVELVIHLMQLGFVTIVDELRRRLL